jgi:hypothetical protein
LESEVGTPGQESVEHVWLRFHPRQVAALFPAETVRPGGNPALAAQMRRIAAAKFRASWHAGDRAMIPPPGQLTVDVDTKAGLRRFFAIDQLAGTAEYIAAFQSRAMRPPTGPWRYDRPVVLLIGQKCMSSNESFVAMMEGAPTVTTMGDRTCGSSGNPSLVELPVEITVSLPRWIDLLADGRPLDEGGIRPRVPFQAELGAFEGERDDLLEAALSRLR